MADHEKDPRTAEASSQAQQNNPAGAAARRQRRPFRLLRWILWPLFILILLLLVAAAGLWLWMGSDNSLAQSLKLAEKYGLLQSESYQVKLQDLKGSLRHGGQLQSLDYQDDALHVHAENITLNWNLRSLLQKNLIIPKIHIEDIRIERFDNAQADADESTGPPEDLRLPLSIQAPDIRIGHLLDNEFPEYSLQDIQAHFDYDQAHYQLTLEHLGFEAGDYQLHARLSDHKPVQVQLQLTGARDAPLPGTDNPENQPLALLASAQGPLDDLQAQAQLLFTDTRFALLDDGQDLLAQAQQWLHENPDAMAIKLHADITPWAPQPLPHADVSLHALDVRKILPEAPLTLLNGTLTATPDAKAKSGEQAWNLGAQLDNANSGSWDEDKLPLEQLQAQVHWQANHLRIQELSSQLAGGQLQAQGEVDLSAWMQDKAEQDDADLILPEAWQLQTQLQNINPARLHSNLAALPLDGHMDLQGQGEQIDFELQLDAREQKGSRPASAGLNQKIEALNLQSLLARGQWHGQWLTLEQADIKTADAKLQAHARIDLKNMGGEGKADLSAPGIQLDVDGEAFATRGQGQIRGQISDAQKALSWAQKLPGADGALQDMQASGQAELNASWQGGWEDPKFQAQLDIPDLSLQTAHDAAPIQGKALQLSAQGSTRQLQIQTRGQLMEGERLLDFTLGVHGSQKPGAKDLLQAQWVFDIEPLELQLQDGADDKKRWTVMTSAPVSAEASARGGGQVLVREGQLQISPPDNSGQASLNWDQIQWQNGNLKTTGQLQNLQLEWLNHFSDALQEAGISGNLILDGSWDINMGQKLQVDVELKRRQGDLQLAPAQSDERVISEVAAGLKDLYVRLRNEGRQLNLQAAWDSEFAGTAQIDLTSQLKQEGGHWTWTPEAPLQGQIQVHVSQLSIWSILAPPGWRLRGELSSDLHVGGSANNPQVNGSLNIEKLAIRSVVDGVQLGRGHLHARLDGQRLIVDDFSLQGPGRDGSGGKITATGEAGWIEGHAQAQINAHLEQLHASVRSDRRLTLSGDLQARIDDTRMTANGHLFIDQARIELPDESTPALGSNVYLHDADGRVASGPQAPAELASMQRQNKFTDKDKEDSPITLDADIRIDLGEDFLLRGMGIETRLEGQLALTAQGPINAMPKITGKIETKDGHFGAYGQNLNITHGVVSFTGPADNPRLDILALRPIYASDQQAGVQITGTALLPDIKLYSRPALPEDQALSWLLFGREVPQDEAQAALLQTAVLATLSGSEGGGLAQTLGLDELGFSSGGEGQQGSLTLGKRLSDRLYAAYEQGLGDAGGALMIFYDLSRRWSLRGWAGEDSALDLLYRLEFN